VSKLSDNIYDNLNTKTIKSVSATDISDVTNPIHIQSATQEALERTILVNRATYRLDGAPIPGTQKVVNFTVDDSGSTNGEVFTPERGETWSISAGSFSSTGGTSRLFLFLKDNVNNVSMEIADESASSGQQNPLDPFNAPGFLIDENCSILATISVTDSSASNVFLSCVRIR
jgi:hypothetical protein